MSTRCSTARFSRRRSRSANDVERPRTVLRALVFVIVFRTSTVYRACWLCDAIEATHNHGAQTSPPSGSWFRGCWAVADDRAIEARPSASRSRPGCTDAVLPGRRLWWLCRPSRATQPLPVVPTPDGAGTTFKTLQVRLLISPCSVLSLGHASRVQDGLKGLEPLLSRFSEVASLLLVPHIRRGSSPFKPLHYWHFQSPKQIMSYDRRCDDHLPPQRRGWV